MNIVKSLIFLSIVSQVRSEACTASQIEDLGKTFENARQSVPQNISTAQQFYDYVVSMLSPEQQAYPCVGCLHAYVVGVYDWALSDTCINGQGGDQCMSQLNNLVASFTECATDTKEASYLGGALTASAAVAASLVLLH